MLNLLPTFLIEENDAPQMLKEDESFTGTGSNLFEWAPQGFRAPGGMIAWKCLRSGPNGIDHLAMILAPEGNPYCEPSGPRRIDHSFDLIVKNRPIRGILSVIPIGVVLRVPRAEKLLQVFFAGLLEEEESLAHV